MVAQNHPDIFEPARGIGNSGDSRAIIGIAADVDSVIFMGPLALAAPQHAADNRRFLPCGDEYRQRLAIFGWRQLLHRHAVKPVIYEQLALDGEYDPHPVKYDIINRADYETEAGEKEQFFLHEIDRRQNIIMHLTLRPPP